MNRTLKKTIIFLRHFPKYRKQYSEFKKTGGVVTRKNVILTDYDDQAGSASGHYFHQDLLVASFIHKHNPVRHIDVGSRIDGFIAHVASFRQIDVMDVRNLENTGHKNISFIKADLMNHNSAQSNITDSISCLHAIEHFGLGRYGDPIDPNGHKKGFNNMLRMLKPGGIFYISFPIVNQNEVHFNAHRIFHPKDIYTWIEGGASLSLERFDYVDDAGKLHQNINIEIENIDVIFGCGIYTFKKIN
jgi:SAM-dependent methyltransferase